MGKFIDFLSGKTKLKMGTLYANRVLPWGYLIRVPSLDKETAYVFLLKKPRAGMLWEAVSGIVNGRLIPNDMEFEFIPAYGDEARPAILQCEDSPSGVMDVFSKYILSTMAHIREKQKDFDLLWAKSYPQQSTLITGFLMECTDGGEAELRTRCAISKEARAALDSMMAERMHNKLCVLGHVPGAHIFINGFQDFAELADSAINSFAPFRLGKYDEQSFPCGAVQNYVLPVAARLELPRVMTPQKALGVLADFLSKSILTNDEAEQIRSACGVPAPCGIYENRLATIAEICGATVERWKRSGLTPDKLST